MALGEQYWCRMILTTRKTLETKSLVIRRKVRHHQLQVFKRKKPAFNDLTYRKLNGGVSLKHLRSGARNIHYENKVLVLQERHRKFQRSNFLERFHSNRN